MECRRIFLNFYNYEFSGFPNIKIRLNIREVVMQIYGMESAGELNMQIIRLKIVKSGSKVKIKTGYRLFLCHIVRYLISDSSGYDCH